MKKLLFFSLFSIFSFVTSAQNCEVNVVISGKSNGVSCNYETSSSPSQMWGIQISAGTSIPSYKNTFVIRGTIVKNGTPSIGYFSFYNQIYSSETAAKSAAKSLFPNFPTSCYYVKRLDGPNGIFSSIVSVWK